MLRPRHFVPLTLLGLLVFGFPSAAASNNETVKVEELPKVDVNNHSTTLPDLVPVPQTSVPPPERTSEKIPAGGTSDKNLTTTTTTEKPTVHDNATSPLVIESVTEAATTNVPSITQAEGNQTTSNGNQTQIKEEILKQILSDLKAAMNVSSFNASVQQIEQFIFLIPFMDTINVTVTCDEELLALLQKSFNYNQSSCNSINEMVEIPGLNTSLHHHALPIKMYWRFVNISGSDNSSDNQNNTHADAKAADKARAHKEKQISTAKTVLFLLLSVIVIFVCYVSYRVCTRGSWDQFKTQCAITRSNVRNWYGTRRQRGNQETGHESLLNNEYDRL